MEVKDLVKRYGDFVAIDHLSLSIEEGESFGLLGPNGSGKTTLISCILALLSYDHGQIQVFGQDMTPRSFESKRKIGMVPQQVAVYDELSVYENIDYFCSLYVDNKGQRRENVDWALSFVSLEDFADFRPPALSGGLLRRLNLACGIAHRPQLIFFDEPTVAVDPQSRNNILEGIKKLNKEGATIIYTSHYMEEVEFLCDRLAILDKGKILVEGSSSDILKMSSISESIEINCFHLPQALLDKWRNSTDILHVEYDQGILNLQLKQGQLSLRTILHEIEDEGLEPLSITSKKPNLNDVFLEITGKELRDNV